MEFEELKSKLLSTLRNKLATASGPSSPPAKSSEPTEERKSGSPSHSSSHETTGRPKQDSFRVPSLDERLNQVSKAYESRISQLRSGVTHTEGSASPLPASFPSKSPAIAWGPPQDTPQRRGASTYSDAAALRELLEREARETAERLREEMDGLRAQISRQRQELEAEKYAHRQKMLTDLAHLRQREEEIKRGSTFSSKQISMEHERLRSLERELEERKQLLVKEEEALKRDAAAALRKWKALVLARYEEREHDLRKAELQLQEDLKLYERERQRLDHSLAEVKAKEETLREHEVAQEQQVQQVTATLHAERKRWAKEKEALSQKLEEAEATLKTLRNESLAEKLRHAREVELVAEEARRTLATERSEWVWKENEWQKERSRLRQLAEEAEHSAEIHQSRAEDAELQLRQAKQQIKDLNDLVHQARSSFLVAPGRNKALPPPPPLPSAAAAPAAASSTYSWEAKAPMASTYPSSFAPSAAVLSSHNGPQGGRGVDTAPWQGHSAAASAFPASFGREGPPAVEERAWGAPSTAAAAVTTAPAATAAATASSIQPRFASTTPADTTSEHRSLPWRAAAGEGGAATTQVSSVSPPSEPRGSEAPSLQQPAPHTTGASASSASWQREEEARRLEREKKEQQEKEAREAAAAARQREEEEEARRQREWEEELDRRKRAAEAQQRQREQLAEQQRKEEEARKAEDERKERERKAEEERQQRLRREEEERKRKEEEERKEKERQKEEDEMEKFRARARARLEAQKANAVPAAPPPPMVFAPMVFEEVEDVETFDDTALSGGDESRSGPPSDGSIDDDEFF